MGSSIPGLGRFARRHVRRYAPRPPASLLHRHAARAEAWGKDLALWSRSNRLAVAVAQGPLGDPHPPDGTSAALLRIGPARRKFVWKHGADRFHIESACQRIIELLGPESGLEPVHGFPIAGGGAWSYVRSRAERRPPDGAVGRAFAHLLVLAAALGLPDTHMENLLWDGRAIRLIDAETFGGTRGPSPFLPGPQRRMNRIAARIAQSALLIALNHHFQGDRDVESIAAHLDEAVAAFTARWDTILALRQAITGRQARALFLSSREMHGLMPFAIHPDMREPARAEFMAHIPADVDRASAFADLVNGCIPVHRFPLPEAEDPSEGAIRPDATMAAVIRAILKPSEWRASRAAIPLQSLLHQVRVEDPGDGGRAAFYAPDNTGVAGEVWFDHPGFLQGLGGMAYLHAVESALGLPSSTSFARDIFEGHAARTAAAAPMPGCLFGLGSELMLGWGLHRLQQLPQGLQKVLDDRLGYLSSTPGPALDLWLGLPGSLVGLARAAGFLPRRQTDLRAWGQALAERVMGEVQGVLADPARQARTGWGFAHGLSGAAFALLQAREALGLDLPVLGPLLAWLRNRLQSIDTTHPPTGPFCQSWAGPLAVLHLAEGDGGWRAPGLSVPPGSPSSGCCGRAAYHLARLAPLARDLKPDVACQGSTPFGYLGLAGWEVIRAAAGTEAPDPLWGRNLL